MVPIEYSRIFIVVTVKNVAVVQRYLPSYRRAFFDNLHADAERAGIRVTIFFCLTLGDVAVEALPSHYEEIDNLMTVKISAGPIEELMVVPKGLFGRLDALKPDLIVSEDISGLPAGLIINAYSRLHNVPYLIWGLGYVVGKKASIWKSLFKPLIWYFRHCARSFIAYSETAAQYYRDSYGKPAIAAYNSTISRKHIATDKNAFAKKYDNRESTNLIFIGRLSRQKRVDKLIIALSGIDRRRWSLDIIGDGDQRDALSELCRQLSLNDKVVFHMAIYDMETKSEIMEHCQLAVLPGLGGLMIQEVYSFGIPVICGPSDGTEIDLVKNINPNLFVEDASVESFQKAIVNFMDTTVEEKIATAERCVDIIREKYNIESMVDAYVSALQENL